MRGKSHHDDDNASPPHVPIRSKRDELSGLEETSSGTDALTDTSSSRSESNKTDHSLESKLPSSAARSSISKKAKLGEEALLTDGVDSLSSEEDSSKQTTGAYPSSASSTMRAGKSLAIATDSHVASRKKRGDGSVTSAAAALSVASNDMDAKTRVKEAVGHKQSGTSLDAEHFYPGAHSVGGVRGSEHEPTPVERLSSTGVHGSRSMANAATPIAAEVFLPEADVEAQAQKIEKRVRQHLMNSSVSAEVVDLATDKGQEIQDKSKKCRFWAILGTLLLLLVGGAVGAAVALTSGNSPDPPTASPVTPVPTGMPTTSKPTMAPTVFIPPCTLCLDGSKPEDLEAEVRRGFTCGDLQVNLAELDSSGDQACKSGQSYAWLFCGCPTLPSSPFSPVCSATCPEDSRPPTFDSKGCLDFETFVEVVGQQVGECAGLVGLAPEECRCSERVSQIRDIVSSVSDETDLLDTNTPQYAALEWLANQDPANLTIAETSTIEWKNRYFGALLWFSLGGESWFESANFLSSLDVCDWNTGDVSFGKGVYCDEDTGAISVVDICKRRTMLLEVCFSSLPIY